MSDRFDHTLERKLESSADAADSVSHVHRIKLIAGTGRRRRWTSRDKARIVVESFTPGANVSEVARRNGLSPQQLFAWRRDARALMTESIGVAGGSVPEPAPAKATASERSPARRLPVFAPVVIAAAAPASPSRPPDPGTIEITIGDAVVCVVGQVETAALTAVLRSACRAEPEKSVRRAS